MNTRTLLLAGAAVAALSPAAHAERGAQGQMNMIFWQAPSTLNLYLSTGTKDITAASLVLEPLANFDAKGDLVAKLAAEIPTLENGGVAQDSKSITWKLKDGVKWSDGTPLTAEDVKFTADYCMDESGGCAQAAKFTGIASVEVVDPLTVKINFTEARPYPYSAFVGGQAPTIQKAQFQDCTGEHAPTCTEQNFAPIGTGPYRVTEFRTNDVATFEANPEYREADKPAFATVNLKGGGDSAGAARAVLETGEYDYAWNMQLAPETMGQMVAAGRGDFPTAFGAQVEHIFLNLTDPSPQLPEGERSTVAHPHPILGDIKVRQALSKAIDRQLLTEIGYGETGRATCDVVNAPEAFASNTQDCMAQDIEGAKALLDEAGWTVGGDGIREKDGRKLQLLFQTSVNPVRQDYQALIKQWWAEIGVGTELKTVDASVYFGTDPGSPDTINKFYADVEMFTDVYEGTDPGTFMAERACSKIPAPANQWQGENTGRFCDPAYDALIDEMGETADPARRAELAKQMNAMLTTQSMAMLPLTWRGRVSAVSNSLQGFDMNPWDTEFWNVADWTRAQ